MVLNEKSITLNIPNDIQFFKNIGELPLEIQMRGLIRGRTLMDMIISA